MRKIWTAVFILAVAGCARPNYQDADPGVGTLSACPMYFESADLCAGLEWQVFPSKKQMGSFVLNFWGREGSRSKPVALDPSLDLSIYLWMPGMSHDSPKPRITETAPGVYRVEKVFFVMTGDWEIRFVLKDGEGHAEERAHSLTY